MHSKTRHHGIQVDDTDPLSSQIVDHNIVQLCIVVGHTQRDLTLCKQFTKYIRYIFVIQNKLNFILHIFCASTDIGLYCPFKCLESCFRIMESFDRLMQTVCRIVRKKSLEISKRIGALIEIFRFFYLIVTGCVRDKFVGTPVFSLIINKIRFSIHSRNDIQSLSVRISTVLDYFLTKVGCHPDDIFHEFYRIGENFLVHSLENHFDPSHLCDFKSQKKCIVNMSVSIWSFLYQNSLILKISDCFIDLYLIYPCHLYLSSHNFCGYTPASLSAWIAATTTGLSSL